MPGEQAVRYSVLFGALGSLMLGLWLATTFIGLSWGLALVFSGHVSWATLFGGVALCAIGCLGFVSGRREARRRHAVRMTHRLVRAQVLERHSQPE